MRAHRPPRTPPQSYLPELTSRPRGVALLNLLFGSGGTWFDPLLPLLVLALIIWGVRRQQLPAISSAVADSK
ncbi:hypothetical protein [Aeromonas hydrophila]|uniref:hypothetical protein n=1 Tax=Aeromonas hydrophila TaxID=644 RepID=UPI000C75A69A|nr:hypothetical protein [Aeromonas hydrophila]AWA05508.1 hypothetical protein C1A23_07595 [Aeromonas hydrophila subsp. hydrophila]